MSRAKAAAERNALDFYATPDPLALAICRNLAKDIMPGHVIEPSAGRGAFVKAASAVWPLAWRVAVEIDDAHRPALLGCANTVWIEDWCRYVASSLYFGSPSPDLIVGNPPYRRAREHVEAGLRWLRPGASLAFLLRLNFLGSSSRVEFWGRGDLASVTPITPRPSFTNGGTDGTEYAVFTWTKGHMGPARLDRPLVWTPERKRRASPSYRPAGEDASA